MLLPSALRASKRRSSATREIPAATAGRGASFASMVAPTRRSSQRYTTTMGHSNRGSRHKVESLARQMTLCKI